MAPGAATCAPRRSSWRSTRSSTCIRTWASSRKAGGRMFGPRRRWLAIFLLALAALAAARGLATLLPAELPFDDAYITLQAADRLAHGGSDPSWPRAAALDGVTSAPHAVLVAAAGLLLPAPRSAQLVALLALLALVLGLWRLARNLGVGRAWAVALTI